MQDAAISLSNCSDVTEPHIQECLPCLCPKSFMLWIIEQNDHLFLHVMGPAQKWMTVFVAEDSLCLEVGTMHMQSQS